MFPVKLWKGLFLVKYLIIFSRNRILHPAQHGFIKGRPTCTNLLECLNHWTVYLQSKDFTTIVYVDFSKAFDVVSHNKLFTRLYSYGICGTVLLWLQNFFCDRTHQTKVGWSLCGVVQGSGIGPVMFRVYINEFIVILEKHNIKVKLFADDIKLCLRILNDFDIALLQSALDSLKNWADSWQLSISIDKCCILNIGKETTHTCLSISGNNLPVHASTRDLGITISSDLCPTQHINDIVAKAHKRALVYCARSFHATLVC